jgi:hypothetical protein
MPALPTKHRLSVLARPLRTALNRNKPVPSEQDSKIMGAFASDAVSNLPVGNQAILM